MSRSKTLGELKRTFKIAGPVLLFAGYCVGLYFASYDKDEGKLNGYILALLILASIVALYLFLQLFSWLKRRRSKRFALQAYEVMALRKDELVDEKTKLIVEKIIPILEENKALNIRITEDLFPRVLFDFSENSKYAFLNRVSLEVISSSELRLEAVLKINYPISLSIKRELKKIDTEKVSLKIPSSKYYSFYSNHPILYEEILVKKEVEELLDEIKSSLELISFNGRFIDSKFNSYETIKDLLLLANFIHDIVMLKDFGDVEVENLVCYECGDPFDITEEVCTKCKAPRPTCIVCLLDLKPSEKKKVIQTPCCRVYTHRDHIVAWLETDSTCPNCKTDQFLWLRKLKQESFEKVKR